jgi:hypothetical protein
MPTKKILNLAAISLIERRLAMGNWLCGNCEAEGDSGVELLFDYSGYGHCPECGSPDITEPEVDEEDEEETDEDEEDSDE